MKRRLRAVIVPLLLLAVTGYFVFNAIHRSRGITAQLHDKAMLADDRATLVGVVARRDRWQARVVALRHHAIARDMLDTEARAVLGMAHPGDLSIPEKPVAGTSAAPR